MTNLKKTIPALQATIVTVAAVLGFLVGLLTLGIVLTLSLASLVTLTIMKKGGDRRAVGRSQKIIVIAAAFFILVAALFPPYWEANIDAGGNLIGKHTKWEFNKNTRELIESVIEDRPVEMISFMRRDSLLLIEILGILALAGAALLVTKKAKREFGKGLLPVVMMACLAGLVSQTCILRPINRHTLIGLNVYMRTNLIFLENPPPGLSELDLFHERSSGL